MKTVKKLLDNFKSNKTEFDSRLPGATPFHQLPTELWLYFCSFLDVRDFVSLCATCKDMQAAGNDEWIWRTFLHRDCKDLGSIPKPAQMNEMLTKHNIRDILGCSWQWLYRSKMVDIRHDKNDMAKRKYIVGHRTTKGGRYEGEWKLGKLNGVGTLMNASGDMIYVGHFRHSEVHGKGVCLFSDGTRYEGEWKGSEAHGKGECWYLDGKRYQGRWKQGKRSGKGTFYWSNGSYFTAKWRDDKPVGKGIHWCATLGIKRRCEWANEFVCCASSPNGAPPKEHPMIEGSDAHSIPKSDLQL